MAEQRKKRVATLPKCSFDCNENAKYDAPTKHGGRWAFMCAEHAVEHGGDLTIGIEFVEGIADPKEGPAVMADIDMDRSMTEDALVLTCPDCDEEKRLELDATGTFNCEGCGRALTIPNIC